MTNMMILLITPTTNSYKSWYRTAKQALLKDYPDHTYIHTSIGTAIYSYHPSHIFFHPDLQDHPFTPYEETWMARSLACRVGPDTKVEWLDVTTSYDTYSCTYLEYGPAKLQEGKTPQQHETTGTYPDAYKRKIFDAYDKRAYYYLRQLFNELDDNTPTIQPHYSNANGQTISATEYHNHYKNLPTQHTTQTPPKTQQNPTCPTQKTARYTPT